MGAIMAYLVGHVKSRVKLCTARFGKLAVMAAVATVLVSGCAGESGGTAAVSTAVDPAIDTSRCVEVSSVVVDAIAIGLDAGLTLRAAQAVRSSAFEHVYLVAADIEGPGLDRTDDIGVWATNRLDGRGAYAASPMAEEFSDWGPLPGESAIGLDGYDEAQGCVRAALG